MPKILHQRGRCIGCNACCDIWPSRWAMSRTDGKCTLVHGKEKKGIWQVQISEDELEMNRRAADACPVKIIRILP